MDKCHELFPMLSPILLINTLHHLTDPFQHPWGCMNQHWLGTVSILCWGEVYCITPALDRYVLLPDRTPRTQMMMSLNICGTAFYDQWHPHSHLSLFTSIQSFCFCPDCFHLSWPPMDNDTPSVDSHEDWLSSTDLVISAQPVALITVGEMWRMWWKRETIGTLKETRCQSWKTVFKEMIWFCLMYPPFWFSTLESKKGYAHITGSKDWRSLL